MKKIVYLLLITSFIFSSEAFSVIHITNARLRPAPQGGNTILFMDIQNTADTADNLVKVESNVSQRAEFHAHTEVSGNMTTIPFILIPEHEDRSFKPEGATHVKLMGLKKALKDGDKVTNLTIHFEHAGKVVIHTTPVNTL
jgi:copper(I)-binding protein